MNLRELAEKAMQDHVRGANRDTCPTCLAKRALGERGAEIVACLAVVNAAKAMQDLPFDVNDDTAAIRCNERLDAALAQLEET